MFLRTTVFSAICLFALLFTSACSKNDPSPDNLSEGSATVQIDGDQKSLSGVARILPDTSFVWSNETLFLGMTNPAQGVLSLGITLFLPDGGSFATATYERCDTTNQIGNDICASVTFLGLTTGGVSSEEGGAITLTITDLDYRIGGFVKGNFSGTVIGDETAIEITDGAFNLEISN